MNANNLLRVLLALALAICAWPAQPAAALDEYDYMLYFPMLLTPGSAGACADETVITLNTDAIAVSGCGVSVSGTTATITDGGTYRAVGALRDGMLAVNTSAAVELILDGATIANADGPAIYVAAAEKTTLTLAAGTVNTLSDGAGYADADQKAALFSNDTLEITGGGALRVTGNYKHGIASDDDLLISNGAITIVSTVKDGFHANDNITVSGGTIDVVSSGSDGFESEGDMLISAGQLTLAVTDDGAISESTMTIAGGTIAITASAEGIESKDTLVVNGGALTIAASDDGLNGINGVTINAGELYIDAAADAIDSNGALAINGGVSVLLGGSAPEGALDCDSCQIALNGGVVVAAGGSNSTPSSASGQHVAVIGARPVNTAMRIVRDDGADTLTFKVGKEYQSMIFTAPALAGSRSYSIYTGGTISGGTSFYGLYSGAGYTGGSVWTTFTTTAVVTYVGGGHW